VHSGFNTEVDTAESIFGSGPIAALDVLVVRSWLIQDRVVRLWPHHNVRNLVLHYPHHELGRQMTGFPCREVCRYVHSLAVRFSCFEHLNCMLDPDADLRFLITDAYGVHKLRAMRIVRSPLLVVLCPGARYMCPRTTRRHKETSYTEALAPNVAGVKELFVLRDEDAARARGIALPPLIEIALDAASLHMLDLIHARDTKAAAAAAPNPVRAEWLTRESFALLFARAAPAVAHVPRDDAHNLAPGARPRSALHNWFRYTVAPHLHGSVVLRVVETAQLCGLEGVPQPTAVMSQFALSPATAAGMSESERQGAAARAAADWLDRELLYSPAFEASLW